MNFEEWCRKNKPSLIDEYIPELNNNLPLSSYKASGKKKLWWRCKEGHEWDASIDSRKNSGCPVCSGKRIVPGINDLKTINPTLAEQYSPDNPTPVDQISPFTHKHVIWNFPCGHSYSAEVKHRHMTDTGCKYCNGVDVLPGFNDLKTLFPEVIKEWDYKRNVKGPEHVRPRSNKPVFWICSFCGRSYSMSPDERLRRGCRFCGKESHVSISEKIIAFYLDKAGFTVVESYRNRDLLGRMELDIFLPELNMGIEYDGRAYHKQAKHDYEKNARCKRAGIELIRFREKGCPEMIGVRTYEVDPDDRRTIIVALGDLLSVINRKFGLNIDIIMDLKTDLSTIVERKYVSMKDASLEAKYPQVAEYLHPDNNIRPSAIPYKSNIPFKWTCPDCGYEWTASVYSVVSSFEKTGRSGCPRCAGKVWEKGENDAATIDPVAAKCWDHERNNDSLSDHRLGDSDIRWWICPECGNSFERQIYVMCRSGSLHVCEPCSKKIAIANRFHSIAESGHNLLDEYPDVSKYWDYNRNMDRPEDYVPGSEKLKYWICSQCGESYEAQIATRTRNGTNTLCGKCGKKKGGEVNRKNALKGGENSLASKYPQLAREWHPSLNGDLKPTDITAQYPKDVWWYCDECKQPWKRAPSVRVRGKGDNGCIYCSGRVYCKGVNDLLTKYPEIAAAWHSTKNGDKKPEDYRYHDDTKVYWQCPNCGKEMFTKIRLKVDSGTPLCKGCRISEVKRRK